MSPYDQCKEKYEESEHDKSWLDMLAWYGAEGFVFLTPNYCAVGIEAEVEGKTCWYVAAAAGNLSRMWEVLPYPLEWVCFRRMLGGKEELRLYRTEDLRRMIPFTDFHG